MAVDTANKRYSMLGLAQPVPSMMPVPDGSFSNMDRFMLEFLYHGISLTGPSATVNADKTTFVIFRDKRSYG